MSHLRVGGGGVEEVPAGALPSVHALHDNAQCSAVALAPCHRSRSV